MNTKETFLYFDKTGTDTRMFHDAIVEAIKNDGKFCDDLADIFVLTKNPEGSRCEWVLNFI